MRDSRPLPAWRRYLRFWGSNIDDDVDAELQFHLEMRVREYVARGMAPDDARRLATERFGSIGRAHADCVTIQSNHARSLGRAELMTTLAHDLRFALRVMRRQAVPSVVAVLCIALGIGATTAMFSIANTLLLRPLPYAHGDRLVAVHIAMGDGRNHTTPVNSLPDVVDWRARQHSFTQLAAVGQSALTVSLASPLRAGGAMATSNLFSTLGITPEYGRLFRDGEDAPDGPAIMLVSHGFAERELGGAATAVGKEILVGGAKRRIVGVIADRVAYPAQTDIWLPLDRDVLQDSRGNRHLLVIGELRPGVTLDAANRDLAAIGDALAAQYPRTNGDIHPYGVLLREEFVGGSRDALVALACASVLILLVACANVAALQTSRATSRAREIAVRTAIGAARGRIVIQLLTESVALALTGGILGVGLAVGLRNVIARAVVASTPPWMTFDIDLRALGFAVAASVFAAILFGLAPALRLTRTDPADALHGGRGVLGIDRGGAQRAFVIAEIALSAVLLVGAELAVQSVMRLHRVTLGFDPTNVVTFRVSMQGQRYDDPAERVRVVGRLLDAVGALPSVESASATTYAPAVGCCSQFPLTIADHPLPPGKQLIVTGNLVTPGFFSTIRIPLLAGRDVSTTDGSDAPLAFVVNETFARTYWPGGNALGRQMSLGNQAGTIVGIVGDVKQGHLTDAAEPQFYFPYAQNPWNAMTIVLRTRGTASPALLMPALRRVARSIDPIALPLSSARLLRDQIDQTITSNTLLSQLLAGFAAIALALAAIGVYAIISFFVAQRTQELGIRVALGAAPSSVRGLVLRETATMAVVGAVIGLAGAVLAARLMARFFYGVSAREIGLYIGASATLAAAALLATLRPAWRAGRVDPMAALRAE